MIVIDTLEFVKELEQAGLSNKQAEAIVRATPHAMTHLVEEQVANKNDMHDLKDQVRKSIGEFRGKV